MGEMAVMGREGDTKVIWDPAVPAEVEAARASFTALKKKNYLAFKVTGANGEKGDLMREFDPDAGRIILSPQMRGG